MIHVPKQHPPIDSGIIAYNCQKYGMPHPVLAMSMRDGAGGRAYDLSGHGNHGTINGADWVAGGLDFDGTNYITTPGIGFDPTKDFTMCGWVRGDSFTMESATSRHVFAQQDGTGAGRSLIYIDSADNIPKSYIGSYVSLGLSALSIGMDYMLSVTYDASVNEVTVHINNDGGNVTGSRTSNAADGLLIIGSHKNTTSGRWNGLMSNALIYNRVLSAAQTKFLYENPEFMYQIPEELYGYAAELVQKLIETKYDIFAQKIIDGEYDIYLQKAISVVYDILLQKIGQVQYDILLNKTIEAKNDILLQRSVEVKYDIHLQKIIDSIYDIFAKKDIETLYDIYLQKDIEAKYDIHLQKIIEALYDIISGAIVQKLLESKYDIYAQKDIEALYDIYLQKDIEALYNIIFSAEIRKIYKVLERTKNFTIIG